MKIIFISTLLLATVLADDYGQRPVGPQLYNILGLGGYDPFGQLQAPTHVYTGEFYDEGPVRAIRQHRYKRDVPSSSYGVPQQSYAAPQPTYGAPQSSYGAPQPSYGAPQMSYGYGGGNSGKGGNKGGNNKGLLKEMESKMKGMSDKFKNFMKDYFNQNSYDYEEPTYYAPSYVPMYYQTYDTYEEKKPNKFEEMGNKMKDGMKKMMDDLHKTANNAKKGFDYMSEKAKDEMDKIGQKAKETFDKMFKSEPEPVYYIPVQTHNTYQPPKPSYGAPAPSYGPPPSTYGAPASSHHKGKSNAGPKGGASSVVIGGHHEGHAAPAIHHQPNHGTSSYTHV